MEASNTTETLATENRALSSTTSATTTESTDHPARSINVSTPSKKGQRPVAAASAPSTSKKSKTSSLVDAIQHPSTQKQSSSSSPLRRTRSNLSYTTEDKENVPPEKRMKETAIDVSDNQSDEYDQDEGLDADLVSACP